MINRTWLPPVILMALIFLVSSVPGDADTSDTLLGFIPPALQNLLHVPLFALLTILWWRALDGRHAALVAVAISLCWGVIDELHQLYVPGRYASLTDLGLNAAGVALGWLSGSRWPRTISR